MKFKNLICGITIAVMSFSATSQTLTPKQDEKGMFGYVDETGNWVVKAKYTEAGQFAGKYAYIKKKTSFGLIDNTGKELVKPKYKYIINLTAFILAYFVTAPTIQNLYISTLQMVLTSK